MVLALAPDSATYQFVLWLHILCAIVGFGSTFVWPFLAAKSRQVGDPKVGYYVGQMSLQGSTILSSYFIYATGFFGVLLIILSEDYWVQFSDTWITLAFVLYIAGLAVSLGLHIPNLKAMGALQEQLATAGGPPPGAESGRPPLLAELEERGKKAAMYGGILHLLFVLILLDMVFKPGSSGAL
jgi:Predicted integral membrane protein (DUF2269)